MNLKEYLIDMTESAEDGLFRTARATKEDKLTWKVEDKGRSVLEQVQECAQAPKWFMAMLKDWGGTPPAFDEAAMAQMKAEREQWDSLDKCEAACKENTQALIQVIKNFPEDKMASEMQLPFREKPFQAADMMLGHYWNLTYHIGQINFIQTLYGDSEMH